MGSFKIISLAAAFSVFAFASHADSRPIYKWKDTNGNIQYSQTKPPSGVQFTVLNYRATKDAAAKPQISNSSSTKVQTTKEDEILAKQAIDQQSVATQQDVLNKKNCKISQTNLQVLESKMRIQVEEDGKKRMLTDKERMDKLTQAKENVDKFCK